VAAAAAAASPVDVDDVLASDDDSLDGGFSFSPYNNDTKTFTTDFNRKKQHTWLRLHYKNHLSVSIFVKYTVLVLNSRKVLKSID